MTPFSFAWTVKRWPLWERKSVLWRIPGDNMTVMVFIWIMGGQSKSSKAATKRLKATGQSHTGTGFGAVKKQKVAPIVLEIDLDSEYDGDRSDGWSDWHEMSSDEDDDLSGNCENSTFSCANSFFLKNRTFICQCVFYFQNIAFLFSNTVFLFSLRKGN